MSDSVFPKDFLWGASTAAHQVEGGTKNQWTVWEQINAKRLAQEAPKQLSSLPSWTRVAREATLADNYISGKGVEHYDRFREDFSLLKKLNMNAFRFSIEWSRIEPHEGQWDPAAIAHYHEYITTLKQLNIEPVLTLWHWTVPTWFTDKGAFEKRSNLKYFERYATKISTEFGKDIRYVITLNEPNVYASLSYAQGWWPPQRKRFVQALRVYYHLMLVHKRAYALIKRASPHLLVGVSQNVCDATPVNATKINKLSVAVINYTWNYWFLNHIKQQQDFVGVNYYLTSYYDWLGRLKNPQKPVNDLGWYMEPSGIQRILEKLWQKYHKPLIVTENGVADANDSFRKWWLEQTLEAMGKALQNGVKLVGYLHWSLLDNFEWSYGWWPKFGLVAVNRKTMQRTIRPSAQWFAKRIKSNKKWAKKHRDF